MQSLVHLPFGRLNRNFLNRNLKLQEFSLPEFAGITGIKKRRIKKTSVFGVT